MKTFLVATLLALVPLVTPFPLVDNPFGNISEVSPFIVNGNPVPDGQFKYQVGLRNRNRVTTFCGGSIIADHWILTAGHCVVDRYTNRPVDTPDIEVVFGTNDVGRKNYVPTGVQKIIPHPKYTLGAGGRWATFDLALVKTTLPLIKMGKSEAIQLAKKGEDFAGQRAVVSGFGVTGWMGGPSSIMKYADVQVQPDFECTRPAYYIYDKETMICGGDYAKGSASGDSGGPLVVTNKNGVKVQVGIVSYGNGFAAWPSIYTRVSYYNDWIKTIMTKYD